MTSAERNNVLLNEVEKLNDVEKAIFKAYYGIDTKPLTIADIASKYEMARATVTNVIDKTSTRLRELASSLK